MGDSRGGLSSDDLLGSTGGLEDLVGFTGSMADPAGELSLEDLVDLEDGELSSELSNCKMPDDSKKKKTK